MGCDIHLHVEHKCRGTWREVYLPEKIGGWTLNYYGYTDRNYDLFGILAHVHVKSCEPICGPRGLEFNNYNDQLSPSVKYEFEERWQGDAHSASWFLLKELLDFDWDKIADFRGEIESYRQAAGQKFMLMIERLKTLDENPENVRIVFWFDN